MAVTTTAVTVTTSATRLDTVADQTNTPAGAIDDGESLLIYNDGSATVYIGGPAVTTTGATKGVPVLAGQYGPSLDLKNLDAVYGIVSSTSVSVVVLESGV